MQVPSPNPNPANSFESGDYFLTKTEVDLESYQQTDISDQEDISTTELHEGHHQFEKRAVSKLQNHDMHKTNSTANTSVDVDELVKNASKVPRTPYACPYCPKKYGNRYNHWAHVRFKHKGFKPNYSCVLCGMCFKRNYDLEFHTSKHTRERPYICKLCDKEFAAGIRLIQHKRFQHQGIGHKCRYCTNEYVTEANCIRHEKQCHPNEFQSRFKMKKVIQASTYNCPLCNKAYFLNKSRLRKHLNSHARGTNMIPKE